MRSKAIFVALLAFAFGAQGALVSQEDAALAACGWTAEGKAFGVRLGSLVESSAEHATTNGAAFYSVKMYGGGTVFMSSDTEMEPVLAFTDSDVDFSEIDRNSPLWALLNRDVSARRAELDSAPLVLLKAASPSSSAQSSAAQSATAKKWASLINRGEALSSPLFVRPLTASPRTAAPGDLRVSPLLKSTWGQSGAGGVDLLACYNYYTPQDTTGVIKEGSMQNAVCGCVATAMGQVMFYHKYPAAATVPDASKAEVCWFNTTKLPDLVVSGEPYDWNAMVASPSLSESEDARKAIGLLTSDAGRSVGMNYTAEESGALMIKAAKALGSVFNFGQSVMVDLDSRRSAVGSMSEAFTLGKVIFSNVDAGYPVMLGISGLYGGHAVCADGYGYQGATPYVHLNMGWSGEHDIWYNLPAIDAGNVSFSSVDEVVYNIIPEGAGLAAMSGRVSDEDGKGIADAEVSVLDAASGAVVTQLVTSATGVWGAMLPAGEYSISVVDAEGLRSYMLDGIELSAPAPEEAERSWQQPDNKTASGKFPVVTTKAALGNSWGNDVTLFSPRVRIVVGSETNLYVSLDAAIKAARTIASPVLEILSPVDLNDDVTIDFNCEIRAAAGDDSSTEVNRPDGATITIASGASLVLSNCVFEATGVVPIVAEAGGKVFIGPGFSAERVAAKDALGFNVIDRVDDDIAVECTVATVAGTAFGLATASAPEALSSSVARLYATFAADKSVRGSVLEISPGSYRLVWESAPVPIASAVGYYVKADGTTNTAMSVDSLFASFENAHEAGLLPADPEVVILKSDPEGLSRDIVADGFSFAIRGEGDASIAPSEAAHIIVTNGGALAISGVSFAGRTGDTFVRVFDGTLTLGEGAALEDLACSGSLAPFAVAGPVAVMFGGTLRLEAGSSIASCRATGAETKGGGVYVQRGGTLELAGGSILDCSAVQKFGGGAYVEVGGNVIVSGASTVEGNVDNGTRASDIFLLGIDDNIVVTASAAGGSIGIRYGNSKGNAPGFVFADASALSSAHDIAATADAFFNNANSGRVAEADGTIIKWVEASSAVGGLEPIDQTDSEAMDRAVAMVEYPTGFSKHPSPSYWESVEDAFASLDGAKGAATVTLLKDDWFESDIAVDCDVTFVVSGTPGEARTLRRLGNVSISVSEGASLTVDGVSFFDYLAGSAAGPLFSVAGGSLVLDGATVSNLAATGRFGAAVSATDGATVTLRNGTTISGCDNRYEYVADNTGYAGAILADGGSVVVLEDCTITGCKAMRTGGVCAENGSVVKVSGAATVSGNAYPDGGDANLTVAASSSLVLTDTLSGKIGVRRDVGSDMAVFGRVDESFSGTDADFVSSAMNFTSDDDNAYGLAVRSADGTTLLVWSTRLGDGNTYTDGDGVVYTLVSVGSTPFPVDRPTGASLVYTGEEQTGVQSGRGYTLSGDVSATDCGSYSATATLAAGYVWSDDGGTDAMEITWSITKATYDLSGITFENATYTYDGTPKRIEISGDLPDGVTVEYLSPDGNDWTQPGEYNVIARFTGDDNHESIPDMTATLKIVTDEPTPPEPPEPDPDPAQPEDVAFISVSLADATWTVAFTNAVEKCWYSLYETNSLAGGFKIDGVEPVTVRQATATDVPTMTFERPASGSQLFWRLVAEPEDAH